MTADLADFKQALSRWASGVTVVTTLSAEGHPKGMTASSFTSVSINPLLILICVKQGLYTHHLITESGFFAVNMLAHSQIEWGKLFAGMMPEVEDRFADIRYTQAVTGAPILPNVIGWVDCRLHQAFDSGDHTIFVGQVVAAHGTTEGQPLIYANRAWGTFQPPES